MPLKAAHSIYLINTPPIRTRIDGVFLLSMKTPGCAGEVRKLLAMVKGLILNVSAYAEPTKDYNLGELMFPRPLLSTLFWVSAQGARGAAPSRY